MMPATPTVPPCTPGVNLVKHLRWSYALLLLLPLFDPGCAARAELSGPAAAVVVCQSHGVSATAIATGPGWTILLSCGHGWYREGQRGQPPEDERSKPMKFIFPTPAAFASGPATSRLVALDVPNDLALVRLDWGPAPYVCPVLDLYQYQGQPKHLIAVGYDELKIPAVQRECHYVRKEACWTVTKESMFHGSSGCSLQSDDGYLCGVYTGYPSDHMPRELEAAVQKAERRRAMLTKGGRPLSQQEQAEYDAVQAQYKRYVLSSRQGLWVQHSLIVKFIRGAGHGELLVRLNQNGPGPAPAHPRPAPPPADPFAGSPRPGPAAPVARRGSPACPT